MDNGGQIKHVYTLDTKDYEARLKQLEDRYRNFTDTATKQTGNLDRTLQNSAKGIAAYFAIDRLKEVPMQLIKVRGEIQQLETSLGVMLRSREAGNKLLAESIQLAAKTPFTLTQVGQGAKQLIAYGSQANNVIKELTMLGDIASGTGSQIQELTYLYGTLRSQGRAYSVDIRQFASRGIPIYDELAKVMKVTKGEINQLVEDGKIGFAQVEQAMQNMTKKGGVYSGMMAENAKSLTGLMSTLEDAFITATNKIGKSQEGILATSIKGVTAVVNNYEPYIKTLGVVVATYGSYKAALMAVAAAQAIVKTSAAATLYVEMSRTLGTLTAGTYAQATAIGVQTRAQAALNAVTAANPFVLLVTILASAAAAYYFLADSTTAAEKAQKTLDDTMQRANKSTEAQKKKTDELVAKIENENRSKKERQKLLDEYIKTNPAILKGITLENIKTDESTRKINENSWAIEKNTKLKAINASLSVAGAEFNKAVQTLDNSAINNTSGFGGSYNQAAALQQSIVSNKAQALKATLIKLAQERQAILNSKYGDGGSDEVTPTSAGSSSKKTQKELDEIWRENIEKRAEYIKALKILNGQIGILELGGTATDDRAKGIIGKVAKEKANIHQLESQLLEKVQNQKEKGFDLEVEQFKVQKQMLNERIGLAVQLANALGPTFGMLAGNAANIYGGFKQDKENKAAGIKSNFGGLAIADFVFELAGKAIAQIKAQKEATRQHFEAMIAYQKAYNIELNNQLVLENKSALISNIKGEYAGQYAKYNDAKKQYEAAINAAKRYKILVAEGGLFSKDEYAYADVIKKFGLEKSDKSFDLTKATTLLSSGAVGNKDAEKAIQEIIAWRKQMDDAKAAIDQLTSSIAGDLQGSLRSALVNAFESGTDAAKAFEGEVSNILENIASQLLFEAVFAKSFEDLKKGLDSSLANGGTDIASVFSSFLQGSPEKIAQFNSGLETFKAQAQALGLNIFNGTGGGQSNDQLSGSIKGVSEQTASLVAGQMNAMRINQFQMITHLDSIARSSFETAENTRYLKEIKEALTAGNNVRSAGFTNTRFS